MATKETDAIDYLEGYQEGKEAGIREVVEWINGYLKECHRLMGNGKVLITQDDFGIWEAKLKEWGVDKPRK